MPVRGSPITTPRTAAPVVIATCTGISDGGNGLPSSRTAPQLQSTARPTTWSAGRPSSRAAAGFACVMTPCRFTTVIPGLHLVDHRPEPGLALGQRLLRHDLCSHILVEEHLPKHLAAASPQRLRAYLEPGPVPPLEQL
ncbi:MAG: hypothetical protein KatS3mg063_0128 [Tepidiforma sp.]|nr:MAG: hypothetical protein KatS3mg063_0128 [Tepidiforma sp.]